MHLVLLILLLVVGCGGSSNAPPAAISPTPSPAPVVLSGHGDKDNLSFLLHGGKYRIEFSTKGDDPLSEVFVFGFYGPDRNLLLKSGCVVTRPCSFDDLPTLTEGEYYLVIRAKDVTWEVTLRQI